MTKGLHGLVVIPRQAHHMKAEKMNQKLSQRLGSEKGKGDGWKRNMTGVSRGVRKQKEPSPTERARETKGLG